MRPPIIWGAGGRERLAKRPPSAQGSRGKRPPLAQKLLQNKQSIPQRAKRSCSARSLAGSLTPEPRRANGERHGLLTAGGL